MGDIAERQFPVLNNRRKHGDPKEFVPWGLIGAHARQAMANHYQSVERLAERGGLSWSEMAAVIEDRKFHNMETHVAKGYVLAASAAYLAAPKSVNPLPPSGEKS